MSTKTSYRDEAHSDACAMVREFIGEVIGQLIDYGEASPDLYNKYPNGDAYHHESHTDKCYNLRDAAEVLYELSEFEETDSGLWEDLNPQAAVQAQAAYTYGNAVLAMWHDLIMEVNEAYESNLDTVHDINANLEAQAELLDTLEEQSKLGALNQVKQATLDTLRDRAASLTPQAIEIAKRLAIQKIVNDCLDS